LNLESWSNALERIFRIKANYKEPKLDDYYCCVYNENTYDPKK